MREDIYHLLCYRDGSSRRCAGAANTPFSKGLKLKLQEGCIIVCPSLDVVHNGGGWATGDERQCGLTSEIVEYCASHLGVHLCGSVERAARETSTLNDTRVKNTRHGATHCNVDACPMGTLMQHVLGCTISATSTRRQ